MLCPNCVRGEVILVCADAVTVAVKHCAGEILETALGAAESEVEEKKRDPQNSTPTRTAMVALTIFDIRPPEDVAGAAIFLASDESKFLTGQMIMVNGGVVM